MKNQEKDFKLIQNHLKEIGFIFPGSSIYGGLANTWDYGPLGVILTNQIKNLWWQEFINQEEQNYGLDSKILLNPEVWKTSGHLQNFVDPLIENKVNNKRYRADHIISELFPDLEVDKMTFQEMENILHTKVKTYDEAKTNWSNIKQFNLMFNTFQGVTSDSQAKIYLRPETAQGIFINFKNVQRSMRAKIPFGIGQIGKSFRNEVTPGNYTFRTREFEQMELEYFTKPEDAEKAFAYYVEKAKAFMAKVGLKKESIRLREHQKDELAHYAKATTDIEFLFPFGWGELMGIANRSDYDLKVHSQASNEELSYLDPESNQKYFPYVIEPSVGLDRLALAILVDAFNIEKVGEDKRIVLKLTPELAPYQVAVMPLSKKHHQESAKVVYQALVAQGIEATYDEAGSIGKRYRRQDAIGTPLVMTIIDQTASEEKVTIRFRDTMKQEEINWKNLKAYL